MSRAEKIQQRLRKEVAEGRYYEAQQTYKATFYRLSGKKTSEALDLLRDGSKTQLSHNQLTCGSELVNMLVQAYMDTETAVTESLLGELKQFLGLISTVSGREPNEVALELRRCAGKAIQWCRKFGSRQDARNIHGTAGIFVYQVLGPLGLGQAALYFRYSTDMRAFAEAVRSTRAMGHESEQDLFSARAVLQVLSCATKPTSVTQLASARELWKHLASRCPTPLDRYIELLLMSLGKLSKPMFNMIRDKYDATLQRDPELFDMIRDVDGAFFGKPDAGGLGKIVEQLLSGPA